MADCLEGCNASPGQTPACQACFSNPTCGVLDACAVQNCALPSEVCYGSG
jgi:hypothetical protein